MALDDGRHGLHETLTLLVAAANDGHGNVAPAAAGRVLPVRADWVEGDLVVLRSTDGSGLERGDRILTIGGMDVGDIYAHVGARISASTEGWRRHKGIRFVLGWGDDDRPELTVRGPDGTVRTIAVERIDGATWRRLRPVKPAFAAEIVPGIRYVDLDGLEWETLRPRLEELAGVQGIVFDMRGYPGSAGYQLFGHLTDEPIHSAYWRTPKFSRPDQRDVAYRESRWNVMPKRPRLPTNLVFITDGRAISYAESCLAIVEAYELGEIVGATTAGTNGNVNRVLLPGGFSMTWTGMRVVKHDGETVHQGVGVAPTVPCTPTLPGIVAGRDELLDKAIEVATTRAGR